MMLHRAATSRLRPTMPRRIESAASVEDVGFSIDHDDPVVLRLERKGPAVVRVDLVREYAAVTKQIETEAAELVRDRQEAETKLQMLRDQDRDVHDQRELLAEVGPDGTCPICAHKLDGHAVAVIEFLDAQLDSILVDGQYYRARLDQLAALPPSLLAMVERRARLHFELFDEFPDDDGRPDPARRSVSYFDQFPSIMDEEPLDV